MERFANQVRLTEMSATSVQNLRFGGIAFATALLVLAAASGCTRTSDGSVVLKKPHMRSLFHLGRAEPEPILPASSVAMPLQQPLPASQPMHKARPPKVTVPAMSIAANPPFKGVDPSKPLDCRNQKTESGRIRVVCG